MSCVDSKDLDQHVWMHTATTKFLSISPCILWYSTVITLLLSLMFYLCSLYYYYFFFFDNEHKFKEDYSFIKNHSLGKSFTFDRFSATISKGDNLVTSWQVSICFLVFLLKMGLINWPQLTKKQKTLLKYDSKQNFNLLCNFTHQNNFNASAITPFRNYLSMSHYLFDVHILHFKRTNVLSSDATSQNIWSSWYPSKCIYFP